MATLAIMEPDFHNQYDCFGKQHGFWSTSDYYGYYNHGMEEGSWSILSHDERTWHHGEYSRGRMVGIWKETQHESLIREILYII